MICCLSEIQTYLGVLYFDLLKSNNATIVRKRNVLGKHGELSGRWLVKNPFLPIQMILGNRASPLCRHSVGRRT